MTKKSRTTITKSAKAPPRKPPRPRGKDAQRVAAFEKAARASAISQIKATDVRLDALILRIATLETLVESVTRGADDEEVLAARGEMECRTLDPATVALGELSEAAVAYGKNPVIAAEVLLHNKARSYAHAVAPPHQKCDCGRTLVGGICPLGVDHDVVADRLVAPGPIGDSLVERGETPVTLRKHVQRVMKNGDTIHEALAVKLDEKKSAPTKFIVWAQDWEESERGWGVRPDGSSLHLVVDDVKKFAAAHAEHLHNQYGDTAPNEYSRPTDREPYRVVVSARNLAELRAAKEAGRSGVWIFPSLRGATADEIVAAQVPTEAI